MSKISEKSSVSSKSRRQFVKKAAYVAPAVLSLQAASAFARVGSSADGTMREIEPVRGGLPIIVEP